MLISADYSQIELRLVAHIGDIPQLKRAFLDGLDIHASTASEMFGVPVEGMPAETRRRAKAINFGIIYGISAFGLANQLSIPQDEAGAYIKTYFERFPGIRAYMDRMRHTVRAQGYVTSLFGRKIHIPAATSRSVHDRQFAERAAINAPIQGAAADVIRRAMIRMPAALQAEGLAARMLLQVHDELVFEAPAEEAEATCVVAKRVMETGRRTGGRALGAAGGRRALRDELGRGALSPLHPLIPAKAGAQAGAGSRGAIACRATTGSRVATKPPRPGNLVLPAVPAFAGMSGLFIRIQLVDMRIP